MTFIRTVLGDIPPAELGVTYAHEHVVIDGGRPVELSEDFLLDDPGRLGAELSGAREAGLSAAIDMMPIDCGRNPDLLAALARRTGVHLVAATGLHHERFYRPGHWSVGATEAELADRFVTDIQDGIVERSDAGEPRPRSSIRAGVIKVAGSEGGPSARDAVAFRAAAGAAERTGVPVHTHCENGTGALEQIRLLEDAGLAPDRISLSHVDKVVDRGYHESILATGASVVYDQGFRWGDRPNGTLQLLEWAAEDGRLGQVMLGMDAARQGYLTAYGGSPGLTFLLGPFTRAMDGRGLDAAARHRLFVDNPARAFAFAPRETQ